MDKPPAKPHVTPAKPLPQPLPIATWPSGLNIKKRWSRKNKLLFSGLGLVVVLVGLGLGAWFWYQSLLAPLTTNKNDHVKVTIEKGSTPAQIGKLLQDDKVIRSAQAFAIYARLTGAQGKLQAGTYRLSTAESTPQIVDHLANGNVDTFKITFLPGATLEQDRQVFLDAGYKVTEVDSALAATYNSPLFDTKPAGADLEGYIFGETYQFTSDATVQDILQTTFDTYEGIITDNDLVAKFKAHGLTLYQGIILSSIVQREGTGSDDAQIAQVFYSRLALGMPLGSDATYQYIADKTGVARDPTLNSPYNTRINTGLPPGPIAVPGLKALQAVGTPASGDYLFFLSGDDGITYFAHTDAEHQQNIADHCKIKCSIN
jgi:UPF0755 protein